MPRRPLLYRAVAIVVALIVFVGFSHTFYLRALFSQAPEDLWHPAGPMTSLYVTHGLVFSAWIAMLLVQVFVVAANRVELHRRLGVIGGCIAAAMCVLGPLVAIDSARHGMPLQFLVTPLADILVFGVLVAAALYFRRDVQTHKRLMIVATIGILPAAIARMPTPFFAGPLEVFGAVDLFLVAVITWDVIARRRLHAAWIWGGLVLVASHPLRVAFAGTETWMSIARWLVA